MWDGYYPDGNKKLVEADDDLAKWETYLEALKAHKSWGH